jgi:hypothetical protein
MTELEPALVGDSYAAHHLRIMEESLPYPRSCWNTQKPLAIRVDSP